ncbi:hypothetical protein ACHAWO_009726 [Cyclotella atomus]|uniref:PDEase domain-containing protein n=1 Tax=Cyclotella atomus TaxID=382360 RepID=A0ABD3PD71_9STRA
MIRDEGSHFIQNADPSKLHNVRKKMIDAVLHTDMTKHFVGVSKIKAVAAGKSWDQLEPGVQWDVLVYMLHMADISNPAKGDPMFKLWTDRSLEEFFQQGDKEREMGVPISPNCDRNTTKRPDSQVGFIKFVVGPAYKVLGEIIPGVNQHVLPVIESNLVYWDEEKKLDETV